MSGAHHHAGLARARTGVVVGLVGFTVAAWGYLLVVASRMHDVTSVLAMPMTAGWSGAQTALMVVMWAVMMAAMMLPSAVPTVSMYDRLDAGSRRAGRPSGSAALFATGYVAAWVVFAVAATGAQWLLHRSALLDGMGVARSPVLAGGLLVGAGLYQLSPMKGVCLRRCRTPMRFLMTEWRDGPAGAVVMGIHHGALCVGCCWALMLLLFVLGVMNLAWVSALAAFVLAEKVAPRATVLVRSAGLVLVAWGAVVIVSP